MKACQGCTKREIGCHGTCETYAKEIEEDRAKKKAFKEENFISEYYTSSTHLTYNKNTGRYVVKSRKAGHK